MEDKMQLILYRGVEMRVPCCFESFYKKYGGEDGMETLFKSIKKHEKMFRKMETIFSDRAEAEHSYAQKLKQIGKKINVMMKDEQGTVAASLTAVGITMFEEAQQHEELHTIFSDKIVTNFKKVIKTYEGTLKQIEKECEKSLQKLNDKRLSMQYFKKMYFKKINWKTADGKKETFKNDQEYLNKCLKLETIRAEFELLTIKSVVTFHSMEKLRLTELHRSCKMYHNHLTDLRTRTDLKIRELELANRNASLVKDFRQLANEPKDSDHVVIEQILPEFPAEDERVKMDKSDRTQSGTQLLAWTRECLEKEQESNLDLLQILQSLDKNDPWELETIETYTNAVIKSSAVQGYLEACQWKFSVLQLGGIYEVPFRNHKYVIRERDNNNKPASFLRMPLSSILRTLTLKLIEDSTMYPHVVALPIINVRASDDYYARQEPDINLKKGDSVSIILTWDSMCWLVLCKGRVGEVPADYIEV